MEVEAVSLPTRTVEGVASNRREVVEGEEARPRKDGEEVVESD